MKTPKYHTSNEFHDWKIGHMGGILIDVDGWACCFASADEKPKAMIELKRSFIPVEVWRPYPDDRRQYAVLLAFAKAAGIPLWIVYFVKGVPIEADTLLHVFELSQARPDYLGPWHEVMRAEDFAIFTARFVAGDVRRP